MYQDTLTILSAVVGAVAAAATGLFIHHETTVRVLCCGSPKQRRASGSGGTETSALSFYAAHVVLAIAQTCTVVAIATLHLTLLFLADLLVMHPEAGAAPPSSADIDAAATSAALFALLVIALDVALTSLEWRDYVANATDAVFMAPDRAAAASAARRRLAEERVTGAPVACLVVLAVHVAYASTVPLHRTEPPSYLATRGDLVGNGGTLVLIGVTVAALIAFALVREAAIWTADAWLARSRALNEISETACVNVHWRFTPMVAVDAVIRAATMIDAFVTAFIVAARPYHYDISRSENWALLYIGLVVCLPSATVLAVAVYSRFWCWGCCADEEDDTDTARVQ